ncbi:MAG: hypothetical protein JXB25_11140, partial [Deltaproteobacteria bacterium]|nr:hypothetical protein [Deltaproteobacteria bacterium]
SQSRNIPPITIKENAFTLAMYEEKFINWEKYWEKFDYKKYGRKSELWDSKFDQIVDKYAVFSLGIKNIYMAESIKKDLLEIINIGCGYPRAWYMFGNLSFFTEDMVNAKIFVEKSLKSLEESKFSYFYRFYAANRLMKIYEKINYDFETMKTIQKKKMRYLALAAADERFTDGNQRYYVAAFLYNFEFNNTNRDLLGIDIFLDEIKRLENLDPWIYHIVMGRYHINNGWAARGTGWAREVSDEGWRIFRSELDKAADYLTRAHNMHPEFPEAAQLMITIQMARSDDLGERAWFDKAIAAQFDHFQAYYNYLYALSPKWGGSHQQMLDFGVACLNTERFDTRVPDVFLQSLKDISKDYGDEKWYEPFTKEGVYKNVKRYFDGVLKQPVKESDYFKILSRYALYAWACGEYEDAKKIRKMVGEKFIPEVASEIKIDPKTFIDDLASR